MDSDELVRLRGDAISRSINVETLINAVICRHYFRKLPGVGPGIPLNFMMEALYDPQFTLSLKVNILLRARPHLTKAKGGKTEGHLRDFLKIRNVFAHRGMELTEFATGRCGVPDPDNPDQDLDFSALHSRLCELQKKIEASLHKEMCDLGLQLLPENPLISTTGPEVNREGPDG